MLADLIGMVATKTSIVWQPVCISALVGSETRRPSRHGYAVGNTLTGWHECSVELDGEPIQRLEAASFD